MNQPLEGANQPLEGAIQPLEGASQPLEGANQGSSRDGEWRRDKPLGGIGLHEKAMGERDEAEMASPKAVGRKEGGFAAPARTARWRIGLAKNSVYYMYSLQCRPTGVNEPTI